MNQRPRTFLAPNASPMTQDGTITYVVGRERIAIIDPGSDDPAHLDALAAVADEAERAVVIVTHDHPDHSSGALALAERTGAALLGGHAGRAREDVGRPDRSRGVRRAVRAVETGAGAAARAAGGGLLADGVSVDTDDGDLIVLRTPGHSPDHIALHWPDASAIFCGDLMMGGMDTAVVAAPEGDLGAYLASLERIRDLAPEIIYPAHGPPFTDPDRAIDRYLRHRVERIDQVRAALDEQVADVRAITDRVYGGSLEPRLRPFAEAAVAAYIAYIRSESKA